MPHIALDHETDWDGFRHAVRRLIHADIDPSRVTWSVGRPGAAPDPDTPTEAAGLSLPRTLVEMAALAIQAREPERFGLLYSLIRRAHTGERVLDAEDDPDLLLARRLALAVRAEAHRMRTHMRYLPVETASGRRYLGWYDPAHFVVAANAQRLAQRFPRLAWSIVTKDATAHWDGATLRLGPGVRQIADDDTLRAWWEQFGTDAMTEATGIASVPPAEPLDEAPRAPDRPPIGPVVLAPHRTGALDGIGRAILSCDHCHLHRIGTQAVFGEGPAGASVMFVGEQPGDQEDVIGRPFVGPAGQIMDQAMEEAGIDRRTVYVTNAVKHFKYMTRGKRRIHQSPDVPEINACRFWLQQEREQVKPALVVMLGGTAARSLLQRQVGITRERGQTTALPDGGLGFVTVHPSYLLRQPDEDAKAREYAAFVRDLRAVRALMQTL